MSATDEKFCTRVIEHYASMQDRQLKRAQHDALVSAQAARAAELVERVRGGRAVLVDDPVGTGKTVISLAAAARLLQSRTIDRVLIVAPNATVAEQWETRARQIRQGGFFTKVARRSPGTSDRWQRGMVRVVTRRELMSPPAGAARHLVIVDEAHRGLQRPGGFHDLLTRWKDAGRLMLVTATPFQMSMTGLTTMLRAGHVKESDLESLRAYGHAATEVVRKQVAGTQPDAEQRAQLGSLMEQAEEVLDRYRGSLSLAATLRIPSTPRLDAPSSLCDVPLSPDWRDAFEVARLVPDLVGMHNGDAFQRRLVSSSEAFWNGAAGCELRRLAQLDPRVRRFTRELERSLGLGTSHPKVAHTVRWASSWANGSDAHHVLIFCVWNETAAAIEAALKKVSGDAFDVERPDQSVPKWLKQQLGTPPPDARPVVVVLQDRFSESIDLDGGRPFLIHHDLPWNPARIRQRWGRVVRASSGFQKVPASGIHVPVLDVHTDRRLHTTVLHRAAIGDQVLLPMGLEAGGLDDGDHDDGALWEEGIFESLAAARPARG